MKGKRRAASGKGMERKGREGEKRTGKGGIKWRIKHGEQWKGREREGTG
jgi:hypothetical protein